MAKIGFDTLNRKSKLKNIMRPSIGPKIPFMQRAGTAAGTAVGKALPYLKALPVIGTAATIAGTLMSDVGKIEEERTFPRAGAVADETRRLQDEADGFIAREAEGLKGAFPLVGGMMLDVKDRVSSFYGNLYDKMTGGPNVPSSMELTPSAAEAIANPPRKPAPTPASSSTNISATNRFSSPYDALLLDRLGRQDQAEVAPTELVNNSYFINKQTGVAPGERQYFKDLPGTTLGKSELPQKLPDRTKEQSPAYESPMVAATKNLNLAHFDARKDSYGDLLSKWLHNVNEGGKLMPALAQTKERAEQQRRSETNRQFGFDALKLGQDEAYQSGTLELGTQELEERRRSSDISNIVRLRGQDLTAQTRTALAGAKGEPKALSYADQLDEQTALTELSLQQFSTAPPGFAEAVPSLVQQGASLEQIQDAFNRISAAQVAAFKTPVGELDPQKLYDAVARELGLS